MRVIIDTSIWSLAFRRNVPDTHNQNTALILKELSELIDECRATLLGPIRQEILSGIADPGQFKKLKTKLQAFEDFPILSGDYEIAAEFFNTCRKNGIQGSHIDFLICAVAWENDMAIFSMDEDFENFSQVLHLKLHQPRTNIIK